MAARYRFVTEWEVEAPVEAVWDAISDSLRWPEWWHGVESVEELEAGDAEGIGSLRRYTWKSALPYRLAFDMRVTRIDKHRGLEGAASGELEGTGVWTFETSPDATKVRYVWDVRTTRPWMNLVAPLLRPAFAWNHDYVMRSGASGLSVLLRAIVIEPERPSRRKPMVVGALAAVSALGAVVFWRRRAA